MRGQVYGQCERCGCDLIIKRHRKRHRFCSHLCARHARLATLEERFAEKVTKTEGGCWIWTGSKYPKGYGSIRWNGRMRAAHRIAYQLLVGPIPDGLQVCHTCDVPACVNPAHLWLGTNDDNMRDRSAKGRQYRPVGELAPKARLTNQQAAEIRRRGLAGTKTRVLAVECGLTMGAVRRIVRGESYAVDSRNNCPA